MSTWKRLLRVVSVVALLSSLVAVSSAPASTSTPFSFTVCNKEIVPDPSDPSVLWFTELDFPDVGHNGKIGVEGVSILRSKATPPSKTGEQVLNLRIELVEGTVWVDGRPVANHLESMGIGKGTPGSYSGMTKTLDPRIHLTATFWDTPEVSEFCAAHGAVYGGARVVGEVHVTPAK